MKEDAPVDASSVTMTSSQIFFMWGLIGLLVAWMVTFAVLALRPWKRKKVEVEEVEVMYSSASIPSAPPLVRVKA